jgi:mRNA-degrading endonuclease RelE of RelBE toxin-antitoxin system
MAQASITEIKEFFGYEGLAEFKKDWTKLDEAERQYFKDAVGEATGKV